MRHLLLALTFAAPVAVPVVAQERVPGVAAQDFTLDPAHSTVIFRVSHIGYSLYTATFDDVAGGMRLDPDDPGGATLSVTVATASLDLHAPPPGLRDEILGPSWLAAAAHPTITFVSTSVTPTGPDTAEIAGALTLAGVTAPATIAARFNGGYDGKPYEPAARLGFAGTATILRSGFGIDTGLPPPGTTFGVGDAVEIVLETEWIGTPGG